MTITSSPSVEFIPVDVGRGQTSSGHAGNSDGPLNVFVHGYRSMTSASQVEAARSRVASLGLPGRSRLMNWASGRWRDSAAVAGLRAAYRVARLRNVLTPWMLLVDAGVVGLAEVAQFKWMERRAERLGRELGPLLQREADGATVNMIGHSLGARVIHRLLAEMSRRGSGPADPRIGDVVLLGGAADLEADNWPDCVRRIDGRLFNAYSPRDRILKITPDLRRRVGGRPMKPCVVDGIEKVINQRFDRVSHVDYWTRLDELLPEIWPPDSRHIAAGATTQQ